MSGEIPTTIDKSTWGPGPWQTEPDRVEWEHAGLPCLMVRHPAHGHWCGYAAVPPGHPFHGKTCDDVDVDAHGGLNYSHPCAGRVCHVPKPGDPDDVWWFGFDCGHFMDQQPGMEAYLRSLSTWKQNRLDRLFDYDDPFKPSYKTLAYVQAEVNGLAEQLSQIK